MGIKRPTRPKSSRRGGVKRIDPAPDLAKIEAAAALAVYSSSEYHCSGPKGQPPKRRFKHASICPKKWSRDSATDALRNAISSGMVSENWEDGFPRHVWHNDGEVIYEARHTRGPAGTFHAYPLEKFEIPEGLTR
jgi:hypothetical protein